MQISEEQQMCTDFDWFALDDEGFIGHFTTAGFKRLPLSVADSAEDQLFISTYFLNTAADRCGYQVSVEFAESQTCWANQEEQSRYLRSFVGMARKGLFSFDIETYVVPELAYFKVASPQQAVHLEDLPKEVQQILMRTVLRGISLRNNSKILYDTTLSV